MVKIIQLFWLRYKVLSFVILFFIVTNKGRAQYVNGNEFQLKNSAYIEIGGNGLWLSLNYDRVLKQKDRLAITGRTGISYLNYCNTLTIPVTLSFLYGENNNFIEIGSGPTLHSVSVGTATSISAQAIIGYRYQQMEEKGILIRIVFTPSLGIYASENGRGKKAIIPLVGLSFGYTF